MISNKNEICLWAEIAFKTILVNGIIYLNDFKDLNLNQRICGKRYNLNYLCSVCASISLKTIRSRYLSMFEALLVFNSKFFKNKLPGFLQN